MSYVLSTWLLNWNKECSLTIVNRQYVWVSLTVINILIILILHILGLTDKDCDCPRYAVVQFGTFWLPPPPFPPLSRLPHFPLCKWTHSDYQKHEKNTANVNTVYKILDCHLHSHHLLHLTFLRYYAVSHNDNILQY